MERFCVYLHKNKKTNEVFYVGIGDITRPYSKKRNKYWHSVVSEYGYYVVIIYENISREMALDIEKSLIKKFGRRDLKKGSLVNLTDGGDVGPSGYRHTDKAKGKIGIGSLGNSYAKGYRHTDDAKKKISDANRNRSVETREKLKTRLGFVVPEEMRKRISDSNKGQKRTQKR